MHAKVCCDLEGSSQKLPQVPAMFVFFLEGLNYLKTF